jgi:hypothetical protein
MKDRMEDMDELNSVETKTKLDDVEAELDVLMNRRTGFDFRREIRRVHAIGRAVLGLEEDAGYDSESLSGQELAERIQDLQRCRARLKDHLEMLESSN